MSSRGESHADFQDIQWVRFTIFHGVLATAQCPCSVLARKKESRKRNLSFHLPVTVSCSPNLRLYQTDSSYIPLGDIYDDHCLTSGIMREQPVLYSGEKVKRVLREFRQTSQRQVCLL